MTNEYKERLAKKAALTALSQIGDDMVSGLVPGTVRSFSELHNYVDANLYGGAEELVERLGMEDATDILNRMQEILNKWMNIGQSLDTPPSTP